MIIIDTNPDQRDNTTFLANNTAICYTNGTHESEYEDIGKPIAGLFDSGFFYILGENGLVKVADRDHNRFSNWHTNHGLVGLVQAELRLEEDEFWKKEMLQVFALNLDTLIEYDPGTGEIFKIYPLWGK